MYMDDIAGIFILQLFILNIFSQQVIFLCNHNSPGPASKSRGGNIFNLVYLVRKKCYNIWHESYHY